MVFFMILFVILYVWQNIEVVKIGMECRRLGERESRLLDENDRLRFEIERYRRMDAVDEFALRNGLRRMRPGDFAIMTVKDTDAE